MPSPFDFNGRFRISLGEIAAHLPGARNDIAMCRGQYYITITNG